MLCVGRRRLKTGTRVGRAHGGVNVNLPSVEKKHADGATSAEPFDPGAVAPLPPGYTAYNGLGYDISTEATISGPHTVTFTVPSAADQTAFGNLRILHAEPDQFDHEQVVWVDQTIQAGAQAPDFANKTVSAKGTHLGLYLVASYVNPQPPGAAAADLSVSITDSPGDTVAAGTNLTYTYNFDNAGPSRQHHEPGRVGRHRRPRHGHD